jgi:hypothetical protein
MKLLVGTGSLSLLFVWVCLIGLLLLCVMLDATTTSLLLHVPLLLLYAAHVIHRGCY